MNRTDLLMLVFFTGSPAYHDLKFNLYNILSSESLNSLSETQNGITWVKKSVLEDLLAETMTDKQVILLYMTISSC